MHYRPNLEQKLLLNLYEYDFNLPKEVIGKILELPRVALVKELEVIIEDSIANFKVYEKENQQREKGSTDPLAPVHAIFLLGELEAIESLPVVDKFLMQSEEFLEFWLGDLITEDLWEPIYKIAKSDITQLFSLIKTSGIYVFAKSSHKEALMQYLLLNPIEIDVLAPKYKELFSFLIARGKKSNPVENWGDAAEDVSLFALDIVSSRLTIFEPDLEEIVKSNLFEEYYPEDWEEVKKRLHSPKEYDTKILTITERYQAICDTWSGYNKLINDTIGANFWNVPSARNVERDNRLQPKPLYRSDTPYVKDTPKVGRNEPCLCGSGKKYKKCCLKK